MIDLTANDRVRLRYEVMTRFDLQAASATHFEADSDTGRSFDIFIPDRGFIVVATDWSYDCKVWEGAIKKPRVLSMYWDSYYAMVADQNGLTPYDESLFFDAVEWAIAWQREQP